MLSLANLSTLQTITEEDLSGLSMPQLNYVIDELTSDFDQGELISLKKALRSIKKYGQQALPGVIQGATTGASVGGPWGALIGGAAGGTLGVVAGQNNKSAPSLPKVLSTAKSAKQEPSSQAARQVLHLIQNTALLRALVNKSLGTGDSNKKQAGTGKPAAAASSAMLLKLLSSLTEEVVVGSAIDASADELDQAWAELDESDEASLWEEKGAVEWLLQHNAG